MNNLNFVERSITLGFKPSEVNFNPKRHWFGVSAYSPDVKFLILNITFIDMFSFSV